MDKHIMIDLETLGTKPGSVILSIGACVVGDTGNSFYRALDIVSCEAFGLTIDAATVKWWMSQDMAARQEFVNGEAVTLDKALKAFSKWVGKQGNLRGIWGNGATFDNVLLRCAYEAAGLPPPWSYRQDRCFRTMREERPVPEDLVTLPGVRHHALDDALWQAKYLEAIAPELLQ